MKRLSCVAGSLMIAGVAFAWPGEKWETSIVLGLNASSGNSETLLGTGSIETGSEGEKDQVRATLTAAYGAQEGDVTTQNENLAGNYRRKIEQGFGYLDGSVLHDDIAGISIRMLAGLGGGYFFRKTDEFTLSAETGMGYLYEDVASLEDDYVTFRVAQELAWTVSKHARLWQSAEYIPKAKDMGNFLFNAEFGAESAINGSMSLRVVLPCHYP
jgi:hypothetical protein